MRQQGEVFTHPGVNCERTRSASEDSEALEGDRTFQVRVMGEGLAAIALGLREVAHALRFHADQTASLRGPR